MQDSPRDRLKRGAAELGLALDALELERLLALVDLVLEWNQKFNLTAIREPLAMVDKHLLDSLTVQPFLKGPFVTDVGTGAGFPGLPLAIVNPRFRFTLIDSVGKKARFVAHAASLLGLAEVKVECVRAENFHPPQRATTVIARALAPLPEFVAEAGHLCAKGGRLIAMKGRDPQAELAGLPGGWQAGVVERVHVPGLADERHLVILERET
jgi:16S rRNA (guanine527-N7)-methyltransferase